MQTYTRSLGTEYLAYLGPAQGAIPLFRKLKTGCTELGLCIDRGKAPLQDQPVKFYYDSFTSDYADLRRRIKAQQRLMQY